jgi:hypothetical protein
MSLFRDEFPVLGAGTQVKELSGYGTGTPLVSYFKPTTREILSTPITAVTHTAANLSGFIYQAPWTCQVVGVHYNCGVAAAAGVLSVERIIGDGVAPAAANGTTIILLTAATMTLSGFAANTRQNVALSTAAGSPLVLNAGDQIASFLSASPTSLAGGILQVEVAQIG